jgi:competence protein ComEC
VGDFDVAKVPHHGSPHQHPGFAAWADAELAVISVGADNSFGHPAHETIADWHESGATVLRTDKHGDIAIVPDVHGSVGWVTRRTP